MELHELHNKEIFLQKEIVFLHKKARSMVLIYEDYEDYIKKIFYSNTNQPLLYIILINSEQSDRQTFCLSAFF